MATQAEVETLKDYVGAAASSTYMGQCLDVAALMVDQEKPTGLPEDIRARAVLEVAAELWHRRNAPNGIKSFGDLDSASVIRVARDAMVAARPLFQPWTNPLVFS